MPTILWYAAGGGLGHVTRASAILRHLRRRVGDCRCLLLATTPYIQPAILQGTTVLRLPSTFEWRSAGYRDRATDVVHDWIASLGRFDLVVVDTFADGLLGELTPELLARADRRALIFRLGGTDPDTSPAWSSYHLVLAPYAESPHPDAEAVGAVLSRQVDEALDRDTARRQLAIPHDAEGPVIFVQHAGDPGEVSSLFELVATAGRYLPRPHHLRFLTPLPQTTLGGPVHHHVYPASELYAAADLVIAGAGYNSHAELACFGKRALYCPFGRSHDDQRARLGATDPSFSLTIDPRRLASMIEQRLATPAPDRTVAGSCDGARTSAKRIATLLERKDLG